MPSLARQLAATTSAWAGEVAPHAEHLTQLLANDAGLTQPPTLLTGDTRRAARPANSRTRPHKAPRPPLPHHVCRECGTDIPTGRVVCDSCHTKVNNERLITMNEAVTRARRATGTHPAQTREVRTKIAQRQREQWQEREAAGTSPGWTGEAWEFRRLIQPGLAGLAPSQLAAATGLSANYCRLIRDGKQVPHVRHWAALRLLGAS